MRFLLVLCILIVNLKAAVYVEISRLETPILTSVVYSSGSDYKYEYLVKGKPLGDNQDLQSLILMMTNPTELWGVYSNVTYNSTVMNNTLMYDNLGKPKTDFVFGYYSSKNYNTTSSTLNSIKNMSITNALTPIPEPSLFFMVVLAFLLALFPRKKYV